LAVARRCVDIACFYFSCLAGDGDGAAFGGARAGVEIESANVAVSFYGDRAAFGGQVSGDSKALGCLNGDRAAFGGQVSVDCNAVGCFNCDRSAFGGQVSGDCNVPRSYY
jgi:hypothetical protein